MKVRKVVEEEFDRVESPVGTIYEYNGKISIENDNFKVIIERDESDESGEAYKVSLFIKHRRVGHDHDDIIYVFIEGIPAETEEPCVHTGMGGYRVVRMTGIKVYGDLVDIEKLKDLHRGE